MELPPSTFQVRGAVIRERRKQMGFDVAELATKAGISRRYLSHLENGTRWKMRPRRYAALRTALAVTDEDLLAPPRSDAEQE